jgi:hypothetical protein
MLPGDEMLVGNCLFHVGFTPASGAAIQAPAPAPALDGDALAGLVSNPDFGAVDLPHDPSEAPVATAGDEELPDWLPEPDQAATAVTVRPDAPLTWREERDVRRPISLDSQPAIQISEAGGPASISDPPPLPTLRVVSESEQPAVPSAPLPPSSKGGKVDMTMLELPPPIAVLPADSEEVPPLPDRALDTSSALASDSVSDVTMVDWMDDSDGENDLPSAPDDRDESPPVAAVPGGEQPSLLSALEEPPVTPEPRVPEDSPSVAPPLPEEDTSADASAEPVAVVDRAANDQSSAPQSEANAWGEVVFVEDQQAQFELGRQAQLVHVGWMIAGAMICGNHTHAHLMLPENRITSDQVLEPRDYFLVKVRGRRGLVEVLSPSEVLVGGKAPTEQVYTELDSLQLDLIRRDEAGEEDFTVSLSIRVDKSLPNPRARLLAIDTDDLLAAALLTRGLPVRAPRRVELDGMQLTCQYDGERVTVSDYLEGYRDGGSFRPFFVQRGGQRFQTAPEDGASFVLEPGDRLVIGASVYVFRVD